jgi:hypothetical protein
VLISLGGDEVSSRKTAVTDGAQTLAWALAEKADFGIAPAIAASPIMWM